MRTWHEKDFRTRHCTQEGATEMKISRAFFILFLGLFLLMLVAVGVFGTWYTAALGEAGLRLHSYLVQPLFNMGGLSITLIFIIKAAIYMVMLVLFSHFTMLVLR